MLNNYLYILNTSESKL